MHIKTCVRGCPAARPHTRAPSPRTCQTCSLQTRSRARSARCWARPARATLGSASRGYPRACHPAARTDRRSGATTAGGVWGEGGMRGVKRGASGVESCGHVGCVVHTACQPGLPLNQWEPGLPWISKKFTEHNTAQRQSGERGKLWRGMEDVA
eukprot:364837-Chlamydomonas_euryale.AAC.20